MAEEANTSKTNDKLTKFPNAEKANQEAPAGLPSAFDLFKPSVNIIQNNLIGFLVLVAVPIILLLVSQGSELFKPASNTAFWNPKETNGVLDLIGTAGFITSILAAPGAILLQLAGVRKKVITWQEAFKQGLQHFWRFLGLIIVLILLLTVSLILLIVPFFIVLPRVFLAPYFLVDRKLGVLESIKASNAAYKAHKGTWGVIGVFFLLNLAGVLPVIGNLLANALNFLYCPSSALRYEQIKLLDEGKAPRTPAEGAQAAA